MSSKCSTVLSRFKDHNTSPDRTQNEQFSSGSQRKSKKTEKSAEKSNTPPYGRKCFYLASFKAEQGEVSLKKRSRSRSRSSRRKHSHLQSPRPGPSRDFYPVSCKSGASSSACGRPHRDHDVTLECVRFLIQA